VFFATPFEFRAWLEEHHGDARELWVGFHKRGSGEPSITWPEAVDEALSFGWIDGVRRRIDSISYTIRFTPRKPKSIWSAVNIKRAKELIDVARMRPAGLKAFRELANERSAIYSYEQRKTAQLGDVYEKRFRANKVAWKFFQAQPPWYQRTATFWVISAKKAETRLKRLSILLKDSERGRSIALLTRRTGRE
jgi:uncharacterized protein YdeI (YjbR/CyaY-like superfamily)